MLGRPGIAINWLEDGRGKWRIDTKGELEEEDTDSSSVVRVPFVLERSPARYNSIWRPVPTSIYRVVFGRPLRTSEGGRERLDRPRALGAFGLDALSITTARPYCEGG